MTGTAPVTQLQGKSKGRIRLKINALDRNNAVTDDCGDSLFSRQYWFGCPNGVGINDNRPPRTELGDGMDEEYLAHIGQIDDAGRTDATPKFLTVIWHGGDP
jgi:hypothetical protein